MTAVSSAAACSRRVALRRYRRGVSTRLTRQPSSERSVNRSPMGALDRSRHAPNHVSRWRCRRPTMADCYTAVLDPQNPQPIVVATLPRHTRIVSRERVRHGAGAICQDAIRYSAPLQPVRYYPEFRGRNAPAWQLSAVTQIAFDHDRALSHRPTSCPATAAIHRATVASQGGFSAEKWVKLTRISPGRPA